MATLKERLLSLLETDEDVIDIIKQIVNKEISKNTSGKEEIANVRECELEERIHKLEFLKNESEEKITFLMAECRNYAKKEKEWHDIIGNKEKEIDSIRSDMQRHVDAKNIAIAQCNQLVRKYASIDEMYTKYVDLGSEIIRTMERVLNPAGEVSETPEIFMAYGIQEGNIVALWEAIAANTELYISQHKLDDILAIFMYFLNLYEKVSYKPIVIIWPQINDIYDERYHTRTSASNAIGVIDSILLPGFSIGKNVNKKSLVIVK